MNLEEELKIKPGEKYRMLGNMHCMGSTKIHILAVVEGMIVYKWYGKHKQWWHYQIESPYLFLLLKEKGQLIKLSN